MSLDFAMVTFDCTDPDALAAWWSDAVGGEVNALAPGEFVMVARQQGPALGFQRVPDPTPGKNKVHLDFHSEDKEAEVTRLVAAGATELGRNSFGPGFDWVVLADPEGNAFCVAGGS
jgi:predicted enzyme related to lactoylglutathione lyase